MFLSYFHEFSHSNQTSIYEHVPSCSYHFSMNFPIQTFIYEHVPSCSYHISMSFPFKPPFLYMFLHFRIIFPCTSHSNLLFLLFSYHFSPSKSALREFLARHQLVASVVDVGTRLIDGQHQLVVATGGPKVRVKHGHSLTCSFGSYSKDWF